MLHRYGYFWKTYVSARTNMYVDVDSYSLQYGRSGAFTLRFVSELPLLKKQNKKPRLPATEWGGGSIKNDLSSRKFKSFGTWKKKRKRLTCYSAINMTSNVGWNERKSTVSPRLRAHRPAPGFQVFGV
jgi:hypothetical protein